MRERGGKNTDKENLGELWDIYYNNRSQNQKVLNVSSCLLETFVSCSIYSQQALASLLQSLSWHSLTGLVSWNKNDLFPIIKSYFQIYNYLRDACLCHIQNLILQKFMNAMRPTIRYIAADRHKGIANVQFVVKTNSSYFFSFSDQTPLSIPDILDSRTVPEFQHNSNPYHKWRGW